MSAGGALARLALIPAGVMVALLGIELALQVGAVAVELAGRERARSGSGGVLRVLCLGDSNTYGLFLERDEAYPAQLEAAWNETHEATIEVLNMGFPGTNSSRLRARLPEMLETFRPDVVIAMVGVNDFWTVPAEAEEDAGHGFSWFLKRHSRVYRGWYMIRRALDPRELEILEDPDWEPAVRARNRARYGDTEFAMGFERAAEPGLAGDAADLEQNLATITEQLRRFGAPLLLMSYPSRFNLYPLANGSIRRIAAETGTPLVDLTAVFEPLCPELECPEWLFPDHHPRATGYRVVAETVARNLADLLAQ